MRKLIVLCVSLLGLAHGQSLTLYTSEVLSDVNALVEAFRVRNPGVEVKVFRSGTGEVVAKLRAELESKNPQPDLLWFANPDFLAELAEKGLLRRIPPVQPGYPLRYAYGGGQFYEVRLLYNVIAVNTAKVKTPPQAWRELVKPEYAGLLAMPDPNFSGGALITLGTLVPRLSFEFFERLKASGMAVEQSNPVLQQKLARGEYGLAITTDFGLRQEAAKGAPLAAVYPKDGAILVPTPLAIPTWSKAPALAERFLNFLLSPEAQALFAERGYYPVMPGAPRPKGAPQAVLALSGMTASSGVLERFNSLFGLKR